jgi:hypothetical protein
VLASKLAIIQVRIEPRESIRRSRGRLGLSLAAWLVALAIIAQALAGASHPSDVSAKSDGLKALSVALGQSVVLCAHADDPSAPVNPLAPHAHDCDLCALCHSLGFATLAAVRQVLPQRLTTVVALTALSDAPPGRRRWLGPIQPRAPPLFA